jgi:hypothetical protein
MATMATLYLKRTFSLPLVVTLMVMVVVDTLLLFRRGVTKLASYLAGYYCLFAISIYVTGSSNNL